MKERLCKSCRKRYPAMQTECPFCGVPAWMPPPPPAPPTRLDTSMPESWWGRYKALHFGPVACVRCHHVGARGRLRERHASGAGVVLALGIAGLLFMPLLGLMLLLAAGLLAVFGGAPTFRDNCKACGATDVVPICTPEGRRIVDSSDAK